MTRRILWSTLFWIACAAPCHGQRVLVGIEGGLVAATSTGGTDPSGMPSHAAAAPGPAVGATFEWPLSHAISFAPEIVYVEKRFDQDQRDLPPFRVRIHTRLSYVEVPLLARVGATRMRRGWFATAGVGLAVLARAPLELNYYNGGAGADHTISFDGADGPLALYRRADAAAIVGGGVGVRRVDVEIRGDLGFLDVRGPAYANVHSQARHTRAVLLLVRFRL